MSNSIENSFLLLQQSFNGTTSALTGPKIQIAIRIGNRLCVVFAGIVNHLHTIFLPHHQLLGVVQTLKRVDELLETRVEQQKSDGRIILCYLICSQIFLPLQIYFGYVIKDSGALILFLYSYNVYINLGVNANELQYIALCHIIQTRFKTINKNIKELKKQLKNNQNEHTNQIQILQQTHFILTKLTGRINSIYDVRLFFSFFCCMTNVLTNLYFMIFGEAVIFEPLDEAGKIKFITITFLWALYYTTRLTMLCFASQKLCKEVKKFYFILFVVVKLIMFKANTTKKLVCRMTKYACNAGLKREVKL